MNSNFSEIITERFSNRFNEVYKSLSGSGKAKVLKYSPVIFKRWYYSALINETTLSPSFIYGASLGVSAGISAPTVRPDVSGARLKGFSVKENRYSISNHPIVSDIKILVDFCSPDVELDEQNHIVEPVFSKISNFLSLADPYYVGYLTAIAFQLRLLKKADAIYSNKAVIANNYTLFKKLNQEEALKKIVDASVVICSKRINSALPKPLPFVSEKGIYSLIKKPIPIDEIYKRIFLPFGLDVERLWEEYSHKGQGQNCEHDTALSSTFFLGVILDKWFITPFSEYLKIIEPIYCFCYNFEDELEYLLDVIKSKSNIDMALFSPCAFYSFTPFGRRLFASEKTGPERTKTPSVSVAHLLGLLEINTSTEGIKDNNKFTEVKEIYSFRVKRADDKRYWIQIDAADYNTPHDIHIEIALKYGFGFTGYIILPDESTRSIHKLTDPKSKGRGRKADKLKLGEMNLTKGRKMTYISDSGIELEIELLKRVPADTETHFPQTVKIGKIMRQN